MTKSRLEAFSDGVIAIIITIMVLELKAPHDTSWHAIKAVLPSFLSYVLSFTLVAIYWGNHHHLFHLVKHVDGRLLWANNHLLFWLSLVPFSTGWMGENHFATWPTVLYGINLLMAGAAYDLMVRSLHRANASDAEHWAGHAKLAWKRNLSVILYLAAIPLAFVHVLIADALFVAVAIMWLIPDRRIEQALGH